MFTTDLDLKIDVQHHADRYCFEALVEGHRCALDYRRHGDVLTVTHTGVPRALQGHGVAAELARAMLVWVREHHLTVVPACSYVRVYMQRHPATQDLLTQRTPR